MIEPVTTTQSQMIVPSQGRPTPALSSDFETFLKMLTAQARYQDPLKPIDSTEYASQLAQFSMVEQQVQTNDTLAALFGQFGASNMASLSGWVGMEARAATPAYFDGTPILVSPDPAPGADAVQLVVSNAAGVEIQRLYIPGTSDPVEWSGRDETGARFLDGVYSFAVESLKDGETIQTQQAEVYGRIAEAQIREGNVVLILEGGQSVPATSVTALRRGE